MNFAASLYIYPLCKACSDIFSMVISKRFSLNANFLHPLDQVGFMPFNPDFLTSLMFNINRPCFNKNATSHLLHWEDYHRDGVNASAAPTITVYSDTSTVWYVKVLCWCGNPLYEFVACKERKKEERKKERKKEKKERKKEEERKKERKKS